MSRRGSWVQIPPPACEFNEAFCNQVMVCTNRVSYEELKEGFVKWLRSKNLVEDYVLKEGLLIRVSWLRDLALEHML